MGDQRSSGEPAVRRLAPTVEATVGVDPVSEAMDAFERLVFRQLSRRKTFMWRNTELPRVLGELLGRTLDIRRLRPQREAPAWAEAELLRLGVMKRRDVDTVSSAYAIHNRLRRVLLEFASPEYVAVVRAGEALRKGEKGDSRPWPPDREELREMLAEQGAVPSAALDKEIELFHNREYETSILHQQARRRARARLLVGLVPLLVILVASFALAFAEPATDEVVLAAVAGALGATLSGTFKVRDRLRTLSEIRAFGAQIVIQPAVGAALALFVIFALDQGLAGVTLPAGGDPRAAAVAVFGFVAGFSEPFALGIAEKVGDTESGKAPVGDQR